MATSAKAPKKKQQQQKVNTEKTIRRPILVWVIFIFATVSLSSLFSYYFMVSGDIVSEGLVGEYHKTLGVLDHVFNVFNPIYFYLCALQLFRLKAIALKLYLGYIPLMAAALTHNLFSPTWRALVEAEPLSYYSIAISFVLYFAYVFYAYQLIKKGIIK
ncbi:MAG: hypothetical protein ACJAT7_002309 [Psychromonas sp.]|jgi:hypothetical protein|uniref:hypothetical protein n=1 Tax=Psychromonas sp. TaxID=1884585 RepID=UPI0039E4DA83